MWLFLWVKSFLCFKGRHCLLELISVRRLHYYRFQLILWPSICRDEIIFIFAFRGKRYEPFSRLTQLVTCHHYCSFHVFSDLRTAKHSMFKVSKCQGLNPFFSSPSKTKRSRSRLFHITLQYGKTQHGNTMRQNTTTWRFYWGFNNVFWCITKNLSIYRPVALLVKVLQASLGKNWWVYNLARSCYHRYEIKAQAGVYVPSLWYLKRKFRVWAS